MKLFDRGRVRFDKKVLVSVLKVFMGMILYVFLIIIYFCLSMRRKERTIDAVGIFLKQLS